MVFKRKYTKYKVAKSAKAIGISTHNNYEYAERSYSTTESGYHIYGWDVNKNKWVHVRY